MKFWPIFVELSTNKFAKLNSQEGFWLLFTIIFGLPVFGQSIFLIYQKEFNQFQYWYHSHGCWTSAVSEHWVALFNDRVDDHHLLLGPCCILRQEEKCLRRLLQPNSRTTSSVAFDRQCHGISYQLRWFECSVSLSTLNSFANELRFTVVRQFSHLMDLFYLMSNWVNLIPLELNSLLVWAVKWFSSCQRWFSSSSFLGFLFNWLIHQQFSLFFWSFFHEFRLIFRSFWR